jgi:hypothetical protein
VARSETPDREPRDGRGKDPEVRRPVPGVRHGLLALGVTLSELDGMLTGIVTDDRTPVELSQFLGMEQSAKAILAHEPHAVHGLLQTPAYAAGIARTVGVAETPDSYVERNVEQRRWRQARVLNGDLTLHGLCRSRSASTKR